MAKARYAVELKAGTGAASFMSGANAVELSEENPVYETDDPGEHAELLKLPFLKDAAKPAKSEAAA